MLRPMSPTQVVQAFYDAFSRRDGEAMASLYADTATFSDPAFPNLDARLVRGMWRMLTTRGKDLVIQYEIRGTDGNVVKAHWEADYTFSATGRKVHNVIDATLRIENGKIVEHRDVFDFRAWLAQAFGLAGKLMPFLLGPLVRSRARGDLEKYLAKHG